MNRYHVKLGEKRTTVSMDNYLSDLLALKIGEKPRSEDAHTAIRYWIQERLDKSNDPERIHVSQWITRKAVELIMDKKISEKYDNWLLNRKTQQ